MLTDVASNISHSLVGSKLKYSTGEVEQRLCFPDLLLLLLLLKLPHHLLLFFIVW